MAVLEGQSVPPSSRPVAVAERPDRRRAWRSPLWSHLLALAVVLLALVPVIGTGASFSADEGAAITQARSLARGDGWIVEHPLPEADPAGRNYPLELSARGPYGVAPFAKHPLYAVMLAGADRVGGITAMVLLSVAGTVAAAGVAAGLARRLDPGLARPALWATGVASPLLFDGYLVMAHALGAACAGAAVWLAVAAVERRRCALALAVAPVSALAVLLRAEAVLFAAALAVVLVLTAVARRHQARGPLVLGVGASAALAGAGAGRLAEAAWARHIVGGPVGGTGGGVDSEVGFLAGQAHAFVLTWLQPGYGTGPSTVAIALVMMLAALVLGAFVARRHPADAGALRMLSLAAAASALVALATGPDNLVPGLLVAFPVGLLGLLVLDRRMFTAPPVLEWRPTSPATAARPQEAALLAAVFGLFALAVIATQYPTGGSSEWGGRYFALGLPLLVPVALLALRRRAAVLDAGVARTAAMALVVCTLALTAMSVLSIRGTHRFTEGLLASVERVAESSGTPRPVIVTSEPVLPRLAWRTFDDQRWLLVDEGDVWPTVRRLEAGGSGPVTVVGQEEVAPGGSQVLARARFSQWRILLVSWVAPG